LLDITDISTAYGVLIHIVGGEDMTLEEVAIAGEQIMEKIPNTKRIIWGAKVDPGLSGRVRVMAVVTGVTCPFLSGIPKPVAAPAPTPTIPKEVAKPLRQAMEHMINALPQETISRAAVFSKEK
jgi:cell division protein FtsZ